MKTNNAGGVGGGGGGANIGLSSIAAITKLDKTNFHEWREDIEIELKIRKLYKAITEVEVDEMIDLQARRIILETMDKDH